MALRFKTNLLRQTCLIAISALAMVTAGCSLPGDTSARYQDRFPINVADQPQILEVPVTERLSAQETQRVAAFARSYRYNGKGLLTVAYPQEQHSQAQLSDMTAVIHQQGVTPKQLEMGTYSAQVDGARGVVLSFTMADALSQGCPNYWGETIVNLNNQKSPRLGCVTQNNLAVMLAEPRDLVEPRALTSPDTQLRTATIQKYRQGADTNTAGGGASAGTTQ